MAALLGAITWNLITCASGFPAPAAHALIGGLLGARSWRRHGPVKWSGVVGKVLVPPRIVPLVGFVAPSC